MKSEVNCDLKVIINNLLMEVPSRVLNPSVLKEWEEMHRPPPLNQPILPSGPVRGRRVDMRVINRQSNMLNKNMRVTCGEQVRRQWRRWQGRREGVTAISMLYCTANSPSMFSSPVTIFTILICSSLPSPWEALAKLWPVIQTVTLGLLYLMVYNNSH